MVAQAHLLQKSKPQRATKSIPQILIYEILDGCPIYYKGYKKVLKKQKEASEIMGCSSLQWKIISYLLHIAFTKFGIENYHIATNEPGLHLDNKNNLCGDILIFTKEQLDASAFDANYTKVPPILHIEVDVTADTNELSEMYYVQTKVQKLLAFGTGKIVWVFTASKKILIVSQETIWEWKDIKESIHLTDDVEVNIGKYLEGNGIVY